MRFRLSRKMVELEYECIDTSWSKILPQNEGVIKRVGAARSVAERLKESGLNATLFVCGSLAKGKVLPDSDVDLLLTLDRGGIAEFYLEGTPYESKDDRFGVMRHAKEELGRLDSFLRSIGYIGVEQWSKTVLARGNVLKIGMLYHGVRLDLHIITENTLSDANYIRFRDVWQLFTEGVPIGEDLDIDDRYKKRLRRWLDGEYPTNNASKLDLYKVEMDGEALDSKFSEGIEIETGVTGFRFDSRGERCNGPYLLVRNAFHITDPEEDRQVYLPRPIYVVRGFPTFAYLENLLIGRVLYRKRGFHILLPGTIKIDDKTFSQPFIFSRIRPEALRIREEALGNLVREICALIYSRMERSGKRIMGVSDPQSLLKRFHSSKSVVRKLIASCRNPQNFSKKRIEEIRRELRKYV